jgi:phage shock protein C
MQCAACQKEIAGDSHFCCYCGARQAAARGARKLMRSVMDKKIAGVCGGMADYFGLDPTLLRIIWAFVALATGLVPGIAAYLIAWFLMPQAPFVAAPAGAPPAAAPGSGTP